MGNCVARQATIVENGECKQPIREAEAMEPSKEEGGDNGSKENHGNNSRSGTGVRIRVVVTQRELVQFLKNNESKYSSEEQLLSEMKLKKRIKVSQFGTSGGWRPALESIPEEH
ncbi:hypothetical protein RHMOL_Rhmol04G0079300 [Rhododendron molle]|uniref:Uncharacterized protein n=1 Tax=Rhododendron molle TaxID=49168 RepID=A0ACC0NZB1_RHOML|nr:hypothetical protein RHMOL_Rhmol04G0079300 [Rhododendron molle]